MYLSYYGLEFNPFDKEIDSKYAFESNDFKILNNRLNFIKEHRGIGLVTGSPGMGKTFAIRNFINSLNKNLYKTVYMCLSTITTMDFYRQLCYELDIIPPTKKVDMFKEIQSRIINLVKDKKVNVFIVLDEAQYLSPSILNDLKLLFNFELDSKNYASVVLVGQPVLNNILSRNIYEALSQRITVSYNMVGITKDELVEYIHSRIKLAHGNDGIFDEQAINAIYSACNGSLRIANNIILKCLILAKAKDKQSIDSDIVLEASNELSFI